MDRSYVIIFVCLLILYFTLCYPTVEKFQRINYLQMHNYLDYKHGNGVMRHGFGNSSKRPSNRVPNVYNRNEPNQIGYIYSQDENNNETYKLYEMHDYKRGRPGYVYKDSKYQDNRDAVLVVIDPNLYNGEELYDGDVINIGLLNEPYVVKLYEIKSVGYGTRYSNKDYRDEMQGYGLLRPVDPGDGQIEEDDRYFILYRQSLDPRRSIYNYYIKDKRGSILELDDQKYKDLDDGDTLLIPGKEKLGIYMINKFN